MDEYLLYVFAIPPYTIAPKHFWVEKLLHMYTQSKFETNSTTATIENHTIKKAIFVCNRHSHRSIYMHKLNE